MYNIIHNNHVTYIQYWLGFHHENSLTVHNTHFLYMCRHACICVYMCAYVCKGMSNCVSICLYMHVHVHACACMCVCVCVCVCMCMCLFVCVCACVCLKITNCWQISHTPPEILYFKSLEIQNLKSIKWYGNYVINKIIIINSVSTHVNYHGMIRSATLCECK